VNAFEIGHEVRSLGDFTPCFWQGIMYLLTVSSLEVAINAQEEFSTM
jgi:hypothetical protein